MAVAREFPSRRCRRKHWRVWTTKTLGDGRQIAVCPLCGYEPTADDVLKIQRRENSMSHHDPHPHDETALKRHDEDEAAVARRQAREDVNLDVSLSSLPALIATVGKLLGAGVTVGELAEKAAEFLAPSDLPAVEAIVAALEAAQKIVNDLAKEKK